MKKLLPLLLAVCILIPAPAWGADLVKFGLLDYLALEFASHEEMERQRPAEQNEDDGIKERVFFDSLNSLVLALQSGRVDYVFLPDVTARYLAAKTPGLSVAVRETSPNIFKMGVLQENSELFTALDSAIAAIQEDGTMAALATEWLATSFAAPKPVPLPQYPGEPIRIGVTGDQPPLDYVAVDGTPAGFNVALVTAISEKLQRPVTLVPIDANARMIALATGRVDAVFWVRLFTDKESSDDNKVKLTRAYYRGYSAYVTKDFPMERLKEIEKIRP